MGENNELPQKPSRPLRIDAGESKNFSIIDSRFIGFDAAQINASRSEGFEFANNLVEAIGADGWPAVCREEVRTAIAESKSTEEVRGKLKNSSALTWFVANGGNLVNLFGAIAKHFGENPPNI